LDVISSKLLPIKNRRQVCILMFVSPQFDLGEAGKAA